MEILFIIASLIASVLAGGLIVAFFNKKDKQSIIKLLLAFSGGFLLSIAFIHFVPELYEHASHNVGMYILLGFLIQLLLEFFSGGIEHGHIHHHGHGKIPWAIIISLGVHSFLEGIPLAAPFVGHETATMHHHGNDNTLLMGIIFHQLPVAIALMTLLMAAKLNKLTSWLILMLFAVMTPIGFIVGYISNESIFDFDFNIILAIVVGMFLHISTTIIFETTENHKFNFYKLMSIISGFAIAILLH
jgi:zinc transporter ZupT